MIWITGTKAITVRRNYVTLTTSLSFFYSFFFSFYLKCPSGPLSAHGLSMRGAVMGSFPSESLSFTAALLPRRERARLRKAAQLSAVT